MMNSAVKEGIVSPSLFLSQSYQDAWADYNRSLKRSDFPVWDHIVITASNAHQAESFRQQIKAREKYLPARSEVLVIPDEGGVRVGSGGATLSVLKQIREHTSTFSGKRIMVIHSGGDSRRVPQYSALGKLFSPVPHELPDGRSSTLFDEFLIAMSAMPGRLREGMLLLSGDVLLLFNPLLIDYPGRGAAAISFKEDVHTGKDHGVFLRGEDGNVRAFLHKQSVETLMQAGAVNDSGAVDIDTGALIFGKDVLEALYSLISTDGQFDEGKYSALVNNKVRLSLYGDFQFPLAEEATLEKFYLEKSEGDFCDELSLAREQVWKALRPFRMKLLRLAPAKFIHFGTTKEILNLMNQQITEYHVLGWNKRVNSSMTRSAGYNSVLSTKAKIGKGCYLEVSYIHSGARIGEETVLSYIDIQNDVQVPDHVVMHGLKQSDGKFVCRIFGTDDNPKENMLFGRILADKNDTSLASVLWKEGEVHTLWEARLYPECSDIKEAVDYALRLYELAMRGELEEIRKWPGRKSLKSGFDSADPVAILDWNNRMAQLVQMNALEEQILHHIPVSKVTGSLQNPLSRLQRQWMDTHLPKADYSMNMRLRYYCGMAAGDEEMASSAFRMLRQEILRETLEGLKENVEARISCDRHEVKLPLRVNWGGGWSDTPPYCNEKGGTVLNAAILLEGERPVKVVLEKIPERKIIFESRDMDVYREFLSLSDLQSVGDPFDPFVLQKAALLACGILPAAGGDMEKILDRLGSGFLMDTEVTGVPKGSGLGTSSILAAACVKALFEFMGIAYSEDDIYAHVLCMEQIMSTGGGWQDQVGGVTDGIKYISSRPGLDQKLRVEHVVLDSATKEELNSRFALIYTGQRRLARNLLRDVVGRYIGNEPDAVYALNEIQRTAALMRFELERGHIDDFAKLLSEHWELSKMIDAGSTNTLIDQIFDVADDLLDGKMVCGAGGGGFLQVILKKDVSLSDLQKRLKVVFSDTEISAWSADLC